MNQNEIDFINEQFMIAEELDKPFNEQMDIYLLLKEEELFDRYLELEKEIAEFNRLKNAVKRNQVCKKCYRFKPLPVGKITMLAIECK